MEKVAAVLSDFNSEVLADEAKTKDIQNQLIQCSTSSAEAKKALEERTELLRSKVEEAAAALENSQTSERQVLSALEAKVKTLMETQAELQSVEEEKTKLESSSQAELLVTKELREAKVKNVSNEDVFSSLVAGTPEDMEEKLSSLKSYLQEIGCEKTLVCAAQGLSTPPEGRGDFDQMAINCIKEELLEKMQQVEAQLSARAPGEKQLLAELLGLEALHEICVQKAKLAEEAHHQVETEMKGFKNEIKLGKHHLKQVTKELEAVKEKWQVEEQKASTIQEASAAFDRLNADTTKTSGTTTETLEPPAKRMRMEEIQDEPTKEMKLEAQVASPARVRVSTGGDHHR